MVRSLFFDWLALDLTFFATGDIPRLLYGGVLDSTLGWSALLPVESEGLSLNPLQKNNRQH
jgi:hypothetical protein